MEVGGGTVENHHFPLVEALRLIEISSMDDAVAMQEYVFADFKREAFIETVPTEGQ
jgi:hypothetical protein